MIVLGDFCIIAFKTLFQVSSHVYALVIHKKQTIGNSSNAG